MTYDGLTPQDVATKRFTPVRGGREGYDMEEVDNFLDAVENSLNQLNAAQEKTAGDLARTEMRLSDANARIAELEQDIVQTRAVAEQQVAEAQAQFSQTAPAVEPAQTMAPVAAPFTAQVEAYDPTQPIRVETVPEASRTAAKLLEHATMSANSILEDAQEESSRVLAAANADAEALMADAHARTASQEEELEQARRRAEEELENHRNETVTALEAEKEVLSGEVSKLRGFETTIRQDLTLYLSQLQEQVAAPLPSDVVENETFDEAPAQDSQQDEEAAPADSEQEEEFTEAPVEEEHEEATEDQLSAEDVQADQQEVVTDEQVEDGGESESDAETHVEEPVTDAVEDEAESAETEQVETQDNDSNSGAAPGQYYPSFNDEQHEEENDNKS